jgi:hypothetical protein
MSSRIGRAVETWSADRGIRNLSTYAARYETVYSAVAAPVEASRTSPAAVSALATVKPGVCGDTPPVRSVEQNYEPPRRR